MGITDDVVTRGSTPLLPSADPFYAPPDDFANSAPGTVLRTRTVEIAQFGIVRQQVTAWQLLYRSNDLNGAPETAVTTVFLPHGADPAEPRPLLAFQCAIDAVSEHCFPSYALRRGAHALGSLSQLEWLVVANALARGWAVSMADHEGMRGAFGAPREPGYRVLDGIRATLGFDRLRLPEQTPVVLWGYSGGGMASSWAAEMAPIYSPELNIAGAALGSPVGDFRAAVTRLNGGWFAGLALMVIAGLVPLYPALGAVVAEQTTPEGLRHLDRAAKMNPFGIVTRYARHSVDKYLRTDTLANLLQRPAMQEMLDDVRLGMHTPACPLLVVQAVHDQIIHVDDVDGQVGRYLAGGARVTYLRDRLSEHGSLMPLSTPLVLDWLAARIAGTPVAESSTRTVWSVVGLAPGLRGVLMLAATALRVLFGRPLRVHASRNTLRGSNVSGDRAA
ncbi:lipase family protein [Nocardia sp. NPDC052001]|uniref:lipase family protein n=1 Tax=Nocardia sp. NPDC052001 TaxID=3154853 RepID=UPI0034175122